tara:strand:- start:1514 stop:1831 length:318 start_codon:yes stop_codon:yes gene_type:complete
LATLTNVGSNRFYSNANGGFCLLPTESLEITAQHALCYLGNNQLEVNFTSNDDFSGISELRLLSLKRTLSLDDSLDTSGIIKLYKPKKKVSLSKSLPKKLKKVEE